MSSDKPKPSKAASSNKVFDVTRPGKSRPDATSKPIIITNRPVLKDPMMTSDPSGPPPIEEKPAPSRSSTKVKIMPLSDDLETTVEPSAPSSAEPTPEPAAEEVPELPQEVPGDEPKGAEPAAEESSVDVKAEEPGAGESATPEVPPETVKETEPGKDGSAEGSTAESKVELDTGEKDGDQPDSQRKDEKEDDEAARKEAERQAELQKIVESKKYYLPIDAVEKRRAKRYVILGTVLILILAAAWVDVALDSGMIHIDGIKALTHFFN